MKKYRYNDKVYSDIDELFPILKKEIDLTEEDFLDWLTDNYSLRAIFSDLTKEMQNSYEDEFASAFFEGWIDDYVDEVKE